MSQLRVNTITNAGGTGATYAPGHVVQVVSVNSNTEVTSTSSSAVSTGLTAVITPKSANSKIAIFTSFPAQNNNSVVASAYTIFRGTVSDTNLGVTAFTMPGFGQLYSSGAPTRTVMAMHYTDSPNTTSATTYTVGFFSGGSTGAIVMHEGRRGTLTLMEIAQ